MEVPGVGTGYESDYTYDLAGNRVSRRVWVAGQILTTSYTYDANDCLIREESAVALAALAVSPSGALLAGPGGSQLLGSSPALGRLAVQTAALTYRPLPGAWSRAGFYAIPAFLLAAFLLPIMTGAVGLRRRKVRGADRLLTCHRLSLLMRGTASLLAATTLVIGLPFDALAQESDLYPPVAPWLRDMFQRMGVTLQQNHVFIQQCWYRAGSRFQWYPGEVEANLGMQRLGNAGFNLLAIPDGLNRALGQSAFGTGAFAFTTASSISWALYEIWDTISAVFKEDVDKQQRVFFSVA